MTHRMLLFMLVAATVAAAQTPKPVRGEDDNDAPLSVEIHRTGEVSANNLESTEIANISGKTITGIVLRFTTAREDGTTYDYFRMEDFVGYPEPEGTDYDTTHHRGFFKPDQVHPYPISLGPYGPKGTKVEPLAVVFDDLSYQGDITWVEEILKSREADTLVYAKWSQEISNALFQARDEADLRSRLDLIQARIAAGETNRNQRVVAADVTRKSVGQFLSALFSPSEAQGNLFRRSQLALEYLNACLKNLSRQATHDTAGVQVRAARRIR